MSSQYFSSHKGDSTDVNLNLGGYATKEDLKNFGADISNFALKTILAELKTKVYTINISKITFEIGISNLVRDTFFNSSSLSIAALRSMNHTKINECIKNNVLTKIADITESIKKDPVKSDTDNKIKSLIEEFQAKTIDIIIKKRVDNKITKSYLDAELKEINDEINKHVLTNVFNAKEKEIEGKIPDTSCLINKTYFDTKIKEIENKISDTNSLLKNAGFEAELKNNNDNVDSNKIVLGHFKTNSIEKKYFAFLAKNKYFNKKLVQKIFYRGNLKEYQMKYSDLYMITLFL